MSELPATRPLAFRDIVRMAGWRAVLDPTCSLERRLADAAGDDHALRDRAIWSVTRKSSADFKHFVRGVACVLPPQSLLCLYEPPTGWEWICPALFTVSVSMLVALFSNSVSARRSNRLSTFNTLPFGLGKARRSTGDGALDALLSEDAFVLAHRLREQGFSDDEIGRLARMADVIDNANEDGAWMRREGMGDSVSTLGTKGVSFLRRAAVAAGMHPVSMLTDEVPVTRGILDSLGHAGVDLRVAR